MTSYAVNFFWHFLNAQIWAVLWSKLCKLWVIPLMNGVLKCQYICFSLKNAHRFCNSFQVISKDHLWTNPTEWIYKLRLKAQYPTAFSQLSNQVSNLLSSPGRDEGPGRVEDDRGQEKLGHWADGRTDEKHARNVPWRRGKKMEVAEERGKSFRPAWRDF